MTTFLPKESFTSVAGRSPGFPVCAARLLPDPRGDQWLMPGTRRRLRRLPVTVAGPRQILTAFPILPPPGEDGGHLRRYVGGRVYGRWGGSVKIPRVSPSGAGGFCGAGEGNHIQVSLRPAADLRRLALHSFAESP